MARDMSTLPNSWPLVAAPDLHPRPFVTETLGFRHLHFSMADVQSSMNLMQPDALVLEYTRTMMGCLLLQPCPQTLAIIGLGGGSLVKFCHRHLQGTCLTVVELNPHVLALRETFQVPADDERLTVLEGDGAAWVQQVPGSQDVLMLDGFDTGGIVPEALCSVDFYQHCHQALRPTGVLVVNLNSDHPDGEVCVARLRQVFGGAVLVVHESETPNCTVFASRGAWPSRWPKGSKGRPACPAGVSLQAWEALMPEVTRVADALRQAVRGRS